MKPWILASLLLGCAAFEQRDETRARVEAWLATYQQAVRGDDWETVVACLSTRTLEHLHNDYGRRFEYRLRRELRRDGGWAKAVLSLHVVAVERSAYGVRCVVRTADGIDEELRLVEEDGELKLDLFENRTIERG
jgi:hypothetical protein